MSMLQSILAASKGKVVEFGGKFWELQTKLGTLQPGEFKTHSKQFEDGESRQLQITDGETTYCYPVRSNEPLQEDIAYDICEFVALRDYDAYNIAKGEIKIMAIATK